MPVSHDRYSISDSEAIHSQHHSGQISFNQNNTNQSSPLYASNEQLTTKNQVRELQQQIDHYNNSSNSNFSTPKAPQKILPKPLIREKNKKVNTNNENLFLNNNDDAPLYNNNKTNRNINNLESNAQSTNFHSNENNFSNKKQFTKNTNNLNNHSNNGFFNGDSDMYGSNNSNSKCHFILNLTR